MKEAAAGFSRKKRRNYDWNTILSGKAWDLEQGEDKDFVVGEGSFRNACYTESRRRKGQVQIERISKDPLILRVQFLPGPESPAPSPAVAKAIKAGSPAAAKKKAAPAKAAKKKSGTPAKKKGAPAKTKKKAAPQAPPADVK